MNPILLDLGIIKIYWYSVTMFLALLFGGAVVLKEAKKFGINEDFMINLFFFMVPFGFIGARLYFVLFHFDYYQANPIEILKIWEGGLAIHGAMIAGLLWTLIYSKKYKISTRRLLDMIVVGLILGQAIGRWGNFFNMEAHGPETTLQFLKSIFIPQFVIDGMLIDGTYYQPTFLYESLWCLIGFIVLLIFRRRTYTKLGQTTCVYMIWYGIGRFFIEGLRTDSLMLGSLKMAQIVSLAMILIGLIAFFILGRGSKFENQYNDEENVNEITY